MKKILVALAFIMSTLSLTVSAQENQVNRIPGVGKDHNQQQYLTYDTGFWMAAEALGGVSTHLESHNLGLTEVDLSAGYRFNQFFKVGAGLGARYYIKQEYLRRHKSAWGMPLFVAVRGAMIPCEYRRTVPYWGIEVGGSIRDGFMWRPTVGIRVGEPRQAFTLGITYMGQELATYDHVGSKSTKYTNFVCLRLGFEF